MLTGRQAIGNFARGRVEVLPGDKNNVVLTLWMLDEAEVYAQVYGVVMTLSDEEASDILDRLSVVKPGQTTVKYRVDSTQDANLFAQNGFVLDLSKGLGRYAELATQRAAHDRRAGTAYEAQHRSARSAFVKSNRSLREDPRFTADPRAG